MRMLKNHFKSALAQNNDFITPKDEELLTIFGEFPRFCPNVIDMMNMDESISMNINDKFRLIF